MTHNFTLDYFSQIDSEDKAYWLGFIAADGNVYRTTLKISLAAVDRNHLLKFKRDINCGHPVYEHAGYFGIRITNKKLCRDLLKYGITPRKSLTLDINLELIPENLHRHFWRGVFDGDGCITKCKTLSRDKTKKYIMWVAKLVGSFKIIENFVQFLKLNNVESKFTIYQEKNLFISRSNGINLPKSIIKLLYENSTIHLDRKKLLADLVLSTSKSMVEYI